MVFFYLLVALLPFNHNDLWESSAGTVSIIKYLGGACVLAAIIRLGATRSFPPLLRGWPARWFLIYFLVEVLSYVTHGGRFSVADTSLFSNLFSILLLFFVTVGLVDSVRRLRWVVLVGIGSVAFNSLYALRQWQVYHNSYADFRTLGGLSGDENLYTLQCLLWLPTCLQLMITHRPRWERVLCSGCFAVTLTGIILAASRGGFLALVAAFLVVIWRSPYRTRSLVLVSFLAVPLALLPSSPLRRLMRPTKSDQESSQSRLMLWKLGLKMFQQNPVVGVGMGGFKLALDRYEAAARIPFHVTATVPHNTYVDIGSELGLAGLIPFLGALGSAYRGLGRAARRARRFGFRFLSPAALGMQAGLVGFAVCAFFLSAWWERMFWLLLFLSISLLEIVRRGAIAAQISRVPSTPVEDKPMMRIA